MFANRAAPPPVPVMAADDGRSLDEDERGRETFWRLKALRASTATRGGGSLTPEARNWNTETPLGAVCHYNGVFTSSFFGFIFFVDGGRVGVKVSRCLRT